MLVYQMQSINMDKMEIHAQIANKYYLGTYLILFLNLFSGFTFGQNQWVIKNTVGLQLPEKEIKRTILNNFISGKLQFDNNAKVNTGYFFVFFEINSQKKTKITRVIKSSESDTWILNGAIDIIKSYDSLWEYKQDSDSEKKVHYPCRLVYFLKYSLSGVGKGKEDKERPFIKKTLEGDRIFNELKTNQKNKSPLYLINGGDLTVIFG